jgi:cbb3-type cytochrome oxidase subunit 3
MKLSDIMAHAGLAGYAEIALVLFVFAFLMISWWVFRPTNTAGFDRAARMPLDDANPVEPRSTNGADHG